MADRRALLGLGAGLLGLALGAAAAVWEVVQLAVIAGALALVAGVSVLRLVQLLRSANGRIDELSSRVDELTTTAEREARARAEAEALRAAEFAERTNRIAVKTDGSDAALTDPESGLFSEAYFHVALDGRIAGARRHLRPVAVVLLEVIEALGTPDTRRADPDVVAKTVKGALREADTVCRLDDGTFGVLLEDTPENGAIWTVERFRRTLAEDEPGLTLWAGISCYPAHGFTSLELLDAADRALMQAREWRQDRIEVATAEA
ncbi:MAG: diguanylate cyclase [Acidimicrobiia bacterium]|nr:diguanylate cyclase [Acidimicrobiia bacterium]